VKVNALFPRFGYSHTSFAYKSITISDLFALAGAVLPLPPAHNFIPSHLVLYAALPITTSTPLHQSIGDEYTTAIRTEGAVMLLTLAFDCDLNPGAAPCAPHFSVARIDGTDPLTRGFSYRYFQPLDGGSGRDLYKLNGIRMVAYVSGRAGLFDFATLATTIGRLSEAEREG
jgi:hypothetical protein